MTKFRVVSAAGEVLVTNYTSHLRAQKNADRLSKKCGKTCRVEGYEAEERTRVRVVHR
jgi:hypothetical protein